MQDANWKIWAIMAAVLVGVTFEFIKRIPEKHGSAWDVENLRINNTSEPYSIRPNLARRTLQPQKPERSRVGALQSQLTREQLEAFIRKNSPQETSFDHNNKDGEPKAVAAATKKKKEDDEYEEVIDPKTGKKIRRKKKKKQAKKEVKKEEVRQAKQDDQPKKEDHDVDAAAEEAIVTGVVNPPTPERPDEAFASLEEWIRRLISGRPDVAETKRFIDLYLKRLVSAEVFYKVTMMMIEDSRPEMKRLGIMCAGLTPSVMSFQVLAQVVQKERSDSTVRGDADRYLARYTDLSNISILEGILRSSSQSYSTVVAAQKVEVAALRYLSRDRNGNGRQPTQTALAASANYFRRFVAILEGLQRSPDMTLKDQAGQTLRSLQNLLNNTQAPPTAVPSQNPPTQTS